MPNLIGALTCATLSLAAAVAAPGGTRHTSSAGDVRFANVTLANGVRLHYAESGPRDGEPVILLHGYPDSWFSFSRLLPLLPPHVRAIMPDQRGHGDSDRPAAGYTPRDMALDVVAFMDALGIDRATVIGHSMGGFIAQQVVAAAPERVARLVVINATTSPRNFNGVTELEREVAALTDPVSSGFIRAFQESTVHVPLPPSFMDGLIRESSKIPARVHRGIVAGLLATGAPPSLAAQRIPTLIIWGDRDAFMPRSEQDALIAQHGTALLRIYRDTGHSPLWERPDEVAADISAFLRMEPAAARSK